MLACAFTLATAGFHTPAVLPAGAPTSRAAVADVRMINLMNKYGIAKTSLTPLQPAPGKKYVGVTSLTEPGGLGRGVSAMDVEKGQGPSPAKAKMKQKSKDSGNYRSY